MLVLVTLATIALMIWGPVTESKVKQMITDQISKALETPVSFTSIGLDIFPPAVEFRDFQFQKDNSPLQSVYAEKIKLTVGLSPSLTGKVRIKNVAIEKPKLKFKFSDMKFEKKQKSKSKFRLPTLRDLVKIQIDQIQVAETALQFEFPGKYFVEIDSGTAGFRRTRGVEYWTWTGTALARKGQSTKKIEKVEILVERKKQEINIQHFFISGEQNAIAMKGKAYPEADLQININGAAKDLLQTMSDMNLMRGKPFLSGDYAVDAQMKGPWDNLNNRGKVTFNNIDLEGRKFKQVQTNFEVVKNQLRKLDGEIFIDDSKLHFDVTNIEQNNKAQYFVMGENVNYDIVQKAIDPTTKSIINARLNVRAQGTIQVKPFLMQGTHQIQSSSMKFLLPDILLPYLPLHLKSVDAQGSLTWNMEDGAQLEGPISSAGMNGKYQFKFPSPRIVQSTWEFGVNKFGEMFDKDYPIRGVGKITGGLNAKEGEMKALFAMDIKDVQYHGSEKASLTGDLIFTNTGTEISNVKIDTNNKKATAKFYGHFMHDPLAENTVEGECKNFDLAWISKLASRKYSFVDGIEGRGDAKVSLRGATAKLEGTVTLDSANVDWKSEKINQLNAKLHIDPAGVDFQNLNINSPTFQINGKGAIRDDEYRGFNVKANKAPISFLGFPAWFSHYMSRVNGTLNLNGPIDNPEVKLNGEMFLVDPETALSKNVGTFKAEGPAAKLAYQIDAYDKKFLSDGTVSLGDTVSIAASGKMNKFGLFSFINETQSAVTGKWEFAGQLDQLKTWNGNVSVDAFELRSNKLTYRNKSPFDMTIANGIFHLTPFSLGDREANVQVAGKSDVDENLNLTVKGKIPLSVFTLLPLKINRADGMAHADLKWSGKLRSPVLNGTVSVRNAYLQNQLFPHAIEDLELQADIEQNRVKMKYFKGRMSEGVVEGRGDLFLAAKSSDMRIFLSGTVDHSWLHFPEWLPALISGNFTLEGNVNKPFLKGNFTVLEGVYKDEWDWKKQILTIGKAARTTRIYRKEEETMQFDLSFVSNNGKFLLRNDIATAQMRGEMRLLGSNSSFGLLGQIEILGGEMIFLERKFTLSPGVVNFTNPNEFMMAFDLNASTRIENTNTDIFLDIRTEQNQIRAYLSSNPVKEETAIIALLTFGADLDDLAVTSGAEQGVSLSLIPSVLSGPVQSRLQTGLKKIKLIDSFQFVPYFSEDTKTTGLRLQVAKKLFTKSRLTYSTDLFDAGNENIFAVEQTMNRNITVQGSVRDNRAEANEDYDLGVDVEFRFDF
jgi:hypothetical protein